jgi:hypothetical protein
VACWHRCDDHRAGRDLDVIAYLDVRFHVDAGAEPNAVAKHDNTGCRARWPGRYVRAKPVVMVV